MLIKVAPGGVKVLAKHELSNMLKGHAVKQALQVKDSMQRVAGWQHYVCVAGSAQSQASAISYVCMAARKQHNYNS